MRDDPTLATDPAFATHGFFLMDQDENAWWPLLVPRGRENAQLRSGLALAGANTSLHRRKPPTAAGNGLLLRRRRHGPRRHRHKAGRLIGMRPRTRRYRTWRGSLWPSTSLRDRRCRTLVMSLWPVSDECTPIADGQVLYRPAQRVWACRGLTHGATSDSRDLRSSGELGGLHLPRCGRVTQLCRHIAPLLSCPTCERSIWRSRIASNVERIRLRHAWAPGYALPGFLLAASLDHAITGRGGRSGRRTEQTMPM